MALSDDKLYLNKVGFDKFWELLRNKINSISDKVDAIALEDSEAIASAVTDGFYFNLSDLTLYEKVGNTVSETSKQVHLCNITRALFLDNADNLEDLDIVFLVDG